MKNELIDYQQILLSLPNTSVILYSSNLEILRIFDQDKLLESLFLGQHKISTWAKELEPYIKVDLEKYCKESLSGSKNRLVFDHPSGKITIQTKDLSHVKGKPVCILIIQQVGGTEYSQEERLIREKNEAEENNEIKSRFLARISHEIRTPLNAIIGFVEQLLKTNLDDKQKNFANIIEKSSVYLLDLVNEILSFSRLESGELKLDEVDFSIENLFREIYDTLKVRAHDKSINLRLTIDERLTMICRGDAFRLKQVVINLVSNGIKFTEYGFVELGVCLLEEKNDLVWIRITVSDTGIGIPKQKQKEIFQEYKQASSGIARKHGGSGLGLTISKRLTEVMKGEI